MHSNHDGTSRPPKASARPVQTTYNISRTETQPLVSMTLEEKVEYLQPGATRRDPSSYRVLASKFLRSHAKRKPQHPLAGPVLPSRAPADPARAHTLLCTRYDDTNAVRAVRIECNCRGTVTCNCLETVTSAGNLQRSATSGHSPHETSSATHGTASQDSFDATASTLHSDTGEIAAGAFEPPLLGTGGQGLRREDSHPRTNRMPHSGFQHHQPYSFRDIPSRRERRNGTKILSQKAQLHDQPHLLSAKDLRRRAATYNHAKDSFMREANLAGLTLDLQLAIASSRIPQLPTHRRQEFQEAILRDQEMLQL